MQTLVTIEHQFIMKNSSKIKGNFLSFTEASFKGFIKEMMFKRKNFKICCLPLSLGQKLSLWSCVCAQPPRNPHLLHRPGFAGGGGAAPPSRCDTPTPTAVLRGGEKRAYPRTPPSHRPHPAGSTHSSSLQHSPSHCFGSHSHTCTCTCPSSAHHSFL